MRIYLLAFLSLLLISAKAQISTTTLCDTSYNHGGFRVNQQENFHHSLVDTDVNSSGVIVGAYVEGGFGVYPRNIVFKYNENGFIDTLFGNNGEVELKKEQFAIHFDTIVAGYSIVCTKILPNNKVLVLGNMNNGVADKEKMRKQLILTLLNEDGSVDSTFGVSGSYTKRAYGTYYSSTPPEFTPVEVEYDFTFAMDLITQPDGKILINGSLKFFDGFNIIQGGSVIIRLNSNGILDTTFNSTGYKTLISALSRLIFINGNGEIVIPIENKKFVNWPNTYSSFVHITKLNAQGDSIYTSPKIFNNEGGLYWGGHTIAMDPDGRIYIARSNCSGADSLIIYRIVNDSILDITYGNGGELILNFGPMYEKNNITCTTDGRIISTSYFYNDSLPMHIAIINSDGSLDNTFGYNGTYVVKAPNICRSDGEPISYHIPATNKLISITPVYGVNNNGDNRYTFMATRIFIDTVTVINPLDGDIEDDNIIVFPNPVHGQLNISFELKDDKEITIDLFANNGQLVRRLLSKQFFHSGKNQQTIYLDPALASGQYILHITAGDYQKGIQIMVE
jgi:uncharacterized delta-60 repeat protein